MDAVCEFWAAAAVQEKKNAYFPMIVHCFIKSKMNVDSSIFYNSCIVSEARCCTVEGSR